MGLSKLFAKYLSKISGEENGRRGDFGRIDGGEAALGSGGGDLVRTGPRADARDVVWSRASLLAPPVGADSINIKTLSLINGQVAGDQSPNIPINWFTGIGSSRTWGFTNTGKRSDSYTIALADGSSFFNWRYRSKNPDWAASNTLRFPFEWWVGDRFSSGLALSSMVGIKGSVPQSFGAPNNTSSNWDVSRISGFYKHRWVATEYYVSDVHPKDGISLQYPSATFSATYPRQGLAASVAENGGTISAQGCNVTLTCSWGGSATSTPSGGFNNLLWACPFSPYPLPSVVGNITYPSYTQVASLSENLTFTEPLRLTWIQGGEQNQSSGGVRTWASTSSVDKTLTTNGQTMNVNLVCVPNSGVGITGITVTPTGSVSYSAGVTESHSLTVTDSANCEVLPGLSLLASGVYTESVTGSLQNQPPVSGIYITGSWVTGYNTTANYSGKCVAEFPRPVYTDDNAAVLLLEIEQTIAVSGSGTHTGGSQIQIRHDQSYQPGASDFPPSIVQVAPWDGAGLSYSAPGAWTGSTTHTWTNFVSQCKLISAQGNVNFGPLGFSLNAYTNQTLPNLSLGESGTISLTAQNRAYCRRLTQKTARTLVDFVGGAFTDLDPPTITANSTPQAQAIGKTAYICARAVTGGYNCLEVTIDSLATNPPSLYGDIRRGIRRSESISRADVIYQLLDTVTAVGFTVTKVFAAEAVPRIPEPTGCRIFTLGDYSDLFSLHDPLRTSVYSKNGGLEVYWAGNHDLSVGPQSVAIATLSPDGVFTWGGRTKRATKYIPPTVSSVFAKTYAGR